MSKTTITINGEECVILPAPKGAFVIARPFHLLYFVQAIAIEINKFKDYAKILYSQARLIEGLSIENPTEISNLVCELMAK